MFFIHKVLAQTQRGLVPEPLPGEGYGWRELGMLLNNLISFGLRAVVAIAVLAIVYGGILLLTAAGNKKQIGDGQKAIIAALVGLAITFGSYIIIMAIIRALTGAPLPSPGGQ